MQTVSADFRVAIKQNVVYSDGSVDIVSSRTVADSVNLTNLVVKGNFIDSGSITGWNDANQYTASWYSTVLTHDALASYTHDQLSTRTYDQLSDSGHLLLTPISGASRYAHYTISKTYTNFNRRKIFVAFDISPTVDINTRATIKAGGYTWFGPVSDSIPGGSSLRYAAVIDTNSAVPAIPITQFDLSIDLSYGQSTTTDSVQLDNVIVIDLTDSYVAGTEPSAAIIENLLSQFADRYIEGTQQGLIPPSLTYGSDQLIKIEISGTVYGDNTILGSVGQCSCTVELIGDRTSEIDLKDVTYVTPTIGVSVDDAYEYVTFQKFLATKITYDDVSQKTTIKGSDILQLLDTPFVDDITLPATLAEIAQSAVQQCGLQLLSTTFYNSDVQIDKHNIQNGLTCKQVLKYVAQACLSYVVVDRLTNKIQIKFAFDRMLSGFDHNTLGGYTYDQLATNTHLQMTDVTSNSVETINTNNYWRFALKENPYGLHGLNQITIDDTKYSAEIDDWQSESNQGYDGVCELYLDNNPLLVSGTVREQNIVSMFLAVAGFKFQPYSLEYRGFPYLEFGDIVDIQRVSKPTLTVPIHTLQIKYDGGLYGRIAGEAPSRVEQNLEATSVAGNDLYNIAGDSAEVPITLFGGFAEAGGQPKYVRKIGKTVYVNLVMNYSTGPWPTTNGQTVIFGQLPVGYRPSSTIKWVSFVSGSPSKPVGGWITTNGELVFQYDSSGPTPADTFSISAFYMV